MKQFKSIISLLISLSLIFGQNKNVCTATCGCTSAASDTMQAQAGAIATTATDPTMATSRQAEDNIKIIEGDIMISQTHQSQMLNGQAAAASAASIYWPNGTVYYSLSVDYTASEAVYIESSLQELQLYVGSAVQFKRVSPGEAADYIEVYSGSGCSSFVGRQTGPQWLSLQRGVCLQKYIIQHEFMHALGFWHEQSRADRDHSVVIWWSNIDSGKCSNFGIFWSPPARGYPAYDTSSIMHYDSMAFSCNSRSATITTKSSAIIPYPVLLTKSDMLRIQYYYGTGDNTTIILGTTKSSNALLVASQTVIIAVAVSASLAFVVPWYYR